MTKEKFWKDLQSGRFVSMVKESSKGRSLSSSLAVYNVLKPMFAEEDDVEKVYFIFLNARNKVLAIENLFSGTITNSSIYPREVAKRLISLKASAFIMAHNHPAGDVTPSAEDKAMTAKLAIAAASINVQLHDHIIVGNGYHSMAESGKLKIIQDKIAEFTA